MTPWTNAFGRSSVARAAFPVRPDFAAPIRDLVAARRLPWVSTGGMYEPIVEGVAFLDGGLHRIDSYGYGMTTLHTGLRVIGWQSLRLLCTELGLRPPARRLSGEPEIIDPAELSARFASIQGDDPESRRRAETIASIVTGADLREVCRRLLGDQALTTGHHPR